MKRNAPDNSLGPDAGEEVSQETRNEFGSEMCPLKKKQRTSDEHEKKGFELQVFNSLGDSDGLVIVSQFLEIQDILKLRLVCKHWSHIMISNSVWHPLYTLIFSCDQDNSDNKGCHPTAPDFLHHKDQCISDDYHYYCKYRKIYQDIPIPVPLSEDIRKYKATEGYAGDKSFTGDYRNVFFSKSGPEDLFLFDIVEFSVGDHVEMKTHKLAVILAILNVNDHVPNITQDIVKVGFAQKHRKIRLSHFCRHVLEGTEGGIVKLGKDEVSALKSNKNRWSEEMIDICDQIKKRNKKRDKLNNMKIKETTANVIEDNDGEEEEDDDGDEYDEYDDDDDDDDDDEIYDPNDNKLETVEYVDSVKKLFPIEDCLDEYQSLKTNDYHKRLSPYCVISLCPNISPLIPTLNFHEWFVPFVHFGEMESIPAIIDKERYDMLKLKSLFGELSEIDKTSFVWDTDQRGWAPGFFNASFSWFNIATFVSIHHCNRNRMYVIKIETGISVW